MDTRSKTLLLCPNSGAASFRWPGPRKPGLSAIKWDGLAYRRCRCLYFCLTGWWKQLVPPIFTPSSLLETKARQQIWDIPVHEHSIWCSLQNSENESYICQLNFASGQLCLLKKCDAIGQQIQPTKDEDMNWDIAYVSPCAIWGAHVRSRPSLTGCYGSTVWT